MIFLNLLALVLFSLELVSLAFVTSRNIRHKRIGVQMLLFFVLSFIAINEAKKHIHPSAAPMNRAQGIPTVHP